MYVFVTNKNVNCSQKSLLTYLQSHKHAINMLILRLSKEVANDIFDLASIVRVNKKHAWSFEKAKLNKSF